MRLYLALADPAFANEGRLAELEFAARAFPHVTLLPIDHTEHATLPPVVDEKFSGNAHRRALACSPLLPGEIVVGEDSGFFVRGLAGAPGTRSDDFADDQGYQGEGTRCQRNVDCVVAMAKKLRYRDASYVCSLAAVRDGQLLAVGTGEVEGQLMDAASEQPGHSFDRGYESILAVLELGRSMAELDPDTRIRTSHRARALVDLVKRLQHAGYNR